MACAEGRGRGRAGAAATLGLLLVWLGGAACQWSDAEPPVRSRAQMARAAAGPLLPPPLAAELREACGIEVVRLAATAGGAMVELRYRVEDARVARECFEAPLRLESLDGGAWLDVPSMPRIGPLRARPSESPRLHYVLFASGRGAVGRGARFALHIGGHRYGGLVVG